MIFKKKITSAIRAIKISNERGARASLVEELFYDFNRSRSQVYVMNFVRGIFFGAGSVIGGTLVIGLIIWVLSLLGHVIPPLGDFFESLTTTLKSTGR
ncbi:hypothetical protein H7Y29_02885 [Microbacteriaceae bacterium]|nr:hypothetical protein [Candidatus Saccharibacteria bacterium]